jgi:hypothetical protein
VTETDEVEKRSTILFGLVLTLRASAMELLDSKDLASARGMVDTIEMLEVKTRGNLSAEEERMLRSVLTELRMAVVRAESAVPTTPGKDNPEPK